MGSAVAGREPLNARPAPGSTFEAGWHLAAILFKLLHYGFVQGDVFFRLDPSLPTWTFNSPASVLRAARLEFRGQKLEEIDNRSLVVATTACRNSFNDASTSTGC